MTKHIAGIILFTFIVGTSAVVAGLFYEAPAKVRSYSYGYEPWHCKKKKRKKRRRHRRPRFVAMAPSSNIVSAVYDKQSGVFEATLSSRVFDSRTRSLANVAYLFFVKDENGASFVGSTTAQGSNISRSLAQELSWLKTQELKGNLYVMIENSPGRTLNIPAFDSGKAVPVLIKNGS